MNTSFRQFKGIGVPAKIQGIIYYAMLNIPYSDPKVIKICNDAIDYVARDDIDKKMLKEYFTTDKSQQFICMEYYCSANTLFRLHKKYVIRVYQQLRGKL